MDKNKTESVKTTQCKTCFKEIDFRAKKCPNCLCGQTIFGKYGITIFWLIILLFIFVGSEVFINSMEYGNTPDHHSYDRYKEKIIISGTELNFGKTDCGGNVIIIGNIENDTEIDWVDINFEVKIYNARGKIIDTVQENNYKFILPSKQNIPFKISMNQNFTNEDYASHSVRIISAKSEYNFY